MSKPTSTKSLIENREPSALVEERTQSGAVRDVLNHLNEKNKRAWFFAWLYGLSILCVGWIFFIPYVTFDGPDWLKYPVWVIISIGVGAASKYTALDTRDVSRLQALVETKDPAHLGSVLETSSTFQSELPFEIRLALQHTLIDLLHRVSEDTDDHLSALHLMRLRELLDQHTKFMFSSDDETRRGRGEPESTWNVPFALAILAAYNHIGGKEALSLVRALTKRLSLPRTLEARMIIRRAAACLPRLEERAAKRPVHLLRPVEAFDDEDKLLRPASNAARDSDETLLRPIEGSTESRPTC
jgi:hypothetical protein